MFETKKCFHVYLFSCVSCLLSWWFWNGHHLYDLFLDLARYDVSLGLYVIIAKRLFSGLSRAQITTKWAVWFCFCWGFTAQSTAKIMSSRSVTHYHCSWAGLDLLSGKPVLSEHASSSNWQLPLGYNGRDHNVSGCSAVSKEMRH